MGISFRSPLSLCKSSGKASSATSMGPKCTKTVCGQENLWEKTSFQIEKISMSKLSECWWAARSTWYASIELRNIKAWHKGVLLNFWVWAYFSLTLVQHVHQDWIQELKQFEKNSKSLPWFLRPNLLSALMSVDWKSLVIDEPSTTTNKPYRLEACAKKRNSLDPIKIKKTTNSPDYVDKPIWIWIYFWQVISLRYPLRKIWVNLLTFQKLLRPNHANY